MPALRAGRLSTVEAIATGRAPRSGRGYRAHRLLGRLPLPRPVSLGLAAPFARPGRSGLTLAAVVLGATAVTFAVGLTSSLRLVVAGVSHSAAQPVQVMLSGPVPGPGVVAAPGQSRGPSAANQRTVVAALRAQPGTLRFVAEAQAMVGVAGLSQPVPATVFRGTATWTGYDLVRGRWYQGPGQIDVPTGFLAATGTSVGDTVTLLLNGRDVPVRIVGEVFDTRNRGVSVITGWGTLAPSDPRLTPDQYDVGLRPGTSATEYAQQLGSRLGSDYYVALNERNSGVVDVMIGLITTLTLLLALVAALGVLNTVVLQTRERVHDLGVFKAVGMTPRQTIVMVVCSVTGIGLVAGLIAVPAGIALHHYVLPAMASAAGLALPASFLDVYTVPEAIALAVAGTVIAIAGALLPASWAANSRTGEALHAE